MDVEGLQRGVEVNFDWTWLNKKRVLAILPKPSHWLVLLQILAKTFKFACNGAIEHFVTDLDDQTTKD